MRACESPILYYPSYNTHTNIWRQSPNKRHIYQLFDATNRGLDHANNSMMSLILLQVQLRYIQYQDALVHISMIKTTTRQCAILHLRLIVGERIAVTVTVTVTVMAPT